MRGTSHLFTSLSNNRSVISRHAPMKKIFIQIRKVKPILHTDSQVLLINQCTLDILIDLLYLQQMRMGLTNGIHQTVTTEVTKTRHIFRPVIAAVCPIPVTILVYLTERLVHPIPDATTLSHRFIFKNIPIFLHATATIPHGMQIFAKNKRTVNILTGYVLFNDIHTAVHTAIDIRIVIFFRTFILYGTVLFYRLQPVIRTLKINSIAGFIA